MTGGVDADLVVVGFGPTGAALAGLAARRGLHVVAVERDTAVFPLPRAVQCDHEALRILQELGCADEIMAGSIVNEGMDLLDADREVLLSLTVPPLTSTGWPSSVFFHQPTFEAVLRRAVVELGVDVRLGSPVSSLEQDDDGVTVDLVDGERLRSAYVVGCDGARSMTRRTIGGALRDTGFEESWLVVDLIVGDGPQLPTRCLQVCDPSRPHTLVPMPAPRFRMEFMLLPGETPEWIQRPATVLDLVSRWLDPSLVEVERGAVYTFHGLVAESWRSGRILLAGDAAHQTPPFLGQGMCAGLRDAANLAWKLSAVITGGAPDALLDTYQAEREPHARSVIDLAVGFGEMICLLDVDAAPARDALLRDSDVPTDGSTGVIPGLGPGPAVGPGGGLPAHQPLVGGRRFDDVVGPRMALVTAVPLDPRRTTARWWHRNGVALDATTHPSLTVMLDGGPACVVRPDRYVLARGTVDDVTARAASTLGRPVPTAVTAGASASGDWREGGTGWDHRDANR